MKDGECVDYYYRHPGPRCHPGLDQGSISVTYSGASYMAEPGIMAYDHFTPSFVRALVASCAWWIENNATHPQFSPGEHENWISFCRDIVGGGDVQTAFDTYLVLRPGENAFFTGYYEPTLLGSFKPSHDYPVPLYALPEEKKFTRKEIREGILKGRGLELVYVSSPVDAFFLEIQGSGRVMLAEGGVMRLGYAGQNGFPYTPIGKHVKEDPCFKGEIDFHTLKAFLNDNLDRAHHYMDQNESYVFFKEILKGAPLEAGPIGTQGLSLTPRHSVACDPVHYPFGIPIIVHVPGMVEEAMTLTQDTGGAIKGTLRFDYFTGYGGSAEKLAGSLKHHGNASMYWPKG